MISFSALLLTWYLNMLLKNETLLLRVLSILSALLVLAALGVVFFLTPLEQTMGAVQKVFYFHLSAAWVGMLAFILAALFGIFYLRKADLKWDRLAAASVEIGLLFTVITILSGMIWARPIWNTWWTWDPRLTTITIMAFTYLGYLLLRRSSDEPEKRARFSAIYAILGVLSVPLTFLSAHLLRSIHPVIFLGSSPEMAMNSAMYRALFLGLFSFSVLYLALLWQRFRLGRLQEEVDRLRQLENEDY